MSGNAVLARDVRRTFPGPDGEAVRAVDGITLQIRSGARTALVGPDGAGKTTFLRMIAGLIRPDSGSIAVLGIDVATDPQAVQDLLGYMPQRFGLYEDLSIQENLDLFADLHGVPRGVRQERFGRLLEMTGLAPFTARPAGKLSGGMKQKLALACTLVRSPDLLILDEPSAGVDPLSRRDLWEILDRLVREERLTLLLSTAYMDEAERCDEVLVLHRGRLLGGGAPADLRVLAAGRTFSAEPPRHMPARELQARLLDAAGLVADAVPRGGQVHFIVEQDSEKQLPGALPAGVVAETRPERLEDAVMVLLRREEPRSEPPAAPPVAVSSGGREGPLVRVRDLTRKFGDFVAVRNTSFDVARGEIFGLLGPNGAGKTTTFRMLCGLLPASGGTIEVAGVNLRTARAQARGRIGYVSQKFALYGNLTVRENLQFFGAAYGLRGKALRGRIDEMLERFGLDPAAKSGILPAGFRQRLAMAAALLHEPDILFLDEPTSGIDPLARRAFWRVITGLAQGGVTVIVTTHFMEEAEYCDRIGIMDAGEMIALGAPEEVRRMADGAGDMNGAFIAIVEAGRRRRDERSAA